MADIAIVGIEKMHHITIAAPRSPFDHSDGTHSQGMKPNTAQTKNAIKTTHEDVTTKGLILI